LVVAHNLPALSLPAPDLSTLINLAGLALFAVVATLWPKFTLEAFALILAAVFVILRQQGY
jgi:hypothetical protein